MPGMVRSVETRRRVSRAQMCKWGRVRGLVVAVHTCTGVWWACDGAAIVVLAALAIGVAPGQLLGFHSA